MNCEDARRVWHDKSDGLSDATGNAALAAHVSTCVSCRLWCDQMRRIAEALDELRVETAQVGVEPSRDIHPSRGTRPSRDRKGVVASVDTPPAHPRRRSAAWWTMGRIAAGIALMLAAGSYIYTNRAPARHDSPGPVANARGSVRTPVANAGVPSAATTLILTGKSAEQYISVRGETSSPNVHIFRLYRAYESPETKTKRKTKDS